MPLSQAQTKVRKISGVIKRYHISRSEYMRRQLTNA